MLIDAHSHLNMYLYKRFGSDITSIIDQINEHQILTLSNSLDMHSYRINKKISKLSEYIIPTFGIHPWRAQYYIQKEENIRREIERNNIIGEIGLDYFFVKNKNHYQIQRDIFSVFLRETKDKVIIVHTKGAEKDCYELIKEYGNKRVIIHWYSGGLKILKKMINENIYFTLGPEINYSNHIKKIAKMLPQDRILTETDNPGGPEWLTGEKGMPILLKKVINGIATIKGLTTNSVEELLNDNFSRITYGLI